MKGKGSVKVHIIARKATNTGFKKMIGNALKGMSKCNKKSYFLQQTKQKEFLISSQKKLKLHLNYIETLPNRMLLKISKKTFWIINLNLK